MMMCRPSGFPLIVDSGLQTVRDVTSFENFLIPRPVMEALQTLRELGFLLDDGNKIFFPKKIYEHLPRYAFALVFSGEKIYTDSWNYVAASVTNSYSTARFRINTERGLVYASRIPQLNGKPLMVLKSMIRSRFEDYNFEPVNGWPFMYYLDFLTNWTKTWTREEIDALDQYYSNGVTLTSLAFLIGLGVPVSLIDDYIDLPQSWVEQVFRSSHLTSDQQFVTIK